MKKQVLLSALVITLCWPWVIPMGDTTQQSTLKEPTFAELEEGEAILDGIIKDEQTSTQVSQLSFFGNTTIGGIRQENNDAITKFDLSKIKSIKILQANYVSKRYPDKDLILARKTSLEGISDEYLIPRHIVICGIDKKTDDEKSWYLNKLDEIIVEQPAPLLPTHGKPHTKPTPSKAQPEKIDLAKPAIAPEPTAKESSIKTVAETQKAQPVQEPVEAVQTTEPEPTTVQQTPEKVEPISVKEQYTEKEIKIVEKKANDSKTVLAALDTLFSAFAGLFKAIFNFIKGLFS